MNRTLIRPFEELDLKIYAYTLPQVPDHNGYIKIGETSRGVEERIKQQVGTAGLTPEIKFHRIAKHVNGQWFHDTDLHRYILSRGIKRADFGQSANEWFYFNGNMDQAEVLTDEFIQTGSLKQQVALQALDYQLRQEQVQAVEETLAYYQDPKKEPEFLWNAKPRFGKTLTTYDLMLRMGAINTLIVTNRPAIANSWYEDFHKFIGHKEPGMKFVSETDSLKGKAMTRNEFVQFVTSGEAEDPKQVTFISLQDLKGAEFAGGSIEKLAEVAEIPWDLLVIDEAHEGVDTLKTDRAFDKINRKFSLHLSGTPFKAIANEKFTADQIYNWSYLDEQEAKANWDPELDTNPYEKLPTLSLFTYQMSGMVQDRIHKGANLAEDDNIDYAFDLNEFFSTREDGRFVYEESVIKFLDNLSQGKMPFSPTEYRHQLDHTFWLLPRVPSAKALEALLKKHPVFKDYQVVLAAGDGESLVDSESEIEESQESKKNQKSYDKVKESIAKYPKTITLSVGQLTTGVTIPEWTAVLMLSNIKSPALYFQAAFRAQNPYEYEKDGQLFRKENAYIFDFAPERTLILFDEFANNLTPDYSQTTRQRQDQIKTLLNFFPVIAEDGQGEMKELNAEEVLTIPRQIKAKEVIRQGFMSNLLFNNVVGIFGAPQELRGILEKIKPEENKKHAKETRPINMTDPMLNDQGEVEIPNEIVINRTKQVFGEKIFHVEDKPESVTVTELTNRFMDTIEDDFDQFQEMFDLNKTQTNRVQSNIRQSIKEAVEEEMDYFTNQTSYLQKNYNEALKNPQNTKTMMELDEERQEKEKELRQEFQQKIQERTKNTLEKTIETESKKVEERKKNETENDTRVHLRGFTRTIPAFLMAYGDRETRLDNFESNIDPDTFLAITSITIEEFKKLRDGFKYIDDEGQSREFKGFFDETVFNASVQEFYDKKEELANYFDESLPEDIFDYIPNQQTNQIYTPRGVVKLMVDKLEEENPGIFQNKDLKFVDLYTKSGLYLTELVKRLNLGLADQIPDQTERIRWILENQVYGVAPSNIIYNIAKNYVYGIHGDVDAGNLVEWDMAKSAQEGTMQEDLIKAYGGEKVKFDVVIGNPPFQESTEGTSDKQIYPYFMDGAYSISDKVILITPARFLFNAGKTPKAWNQKMLNDPHLKVTFYEQNSAKIFPTTDIKGGVTVTYRDREQELGPIGTFTIFSELNSILHKVVIDNKDFEDITNQIYLQNKFNLNRLYEDYPSYKKVIGSNGNEKRLTTKIFTQLDLFTVDRADSNDIEILGLIDNKRIYKFIPRKYLEDQENLEHYKVIFPKSNGTGAIGEVISTPLLGTPLLGYTQSFMSIGKFENKIEGANCLKYIKSKFCRVMLGTLKITQDNNTSTWTNVPLQDFTPKSDIDWSKSIPEIDQQLYAKYGLSKEEIQFIEENVQPME
ncbi:Eco57I restriction-modification methylase domain-containing protein [Facklamia hominis]|uniref:Eco57I restriction-modification methylase domain-containing protein n=1 Tax=Facklamia hominis TaxID=178214 RepID=A0AAJ1Q5R1_9LACT|nr:Eco57I restriction-modification methylase domain-containing protein [Facklamia hominis]MDK7187046.1 Eco57I restriction-modification methylase domain-containing protein [Facklamia hominis]